MVKVLPEVLFGDLNPINAVTNNSDTQVQACTGQATQAKGGVVDLRSLGSFLTAGVWCGGGRGNRSSISALGCRI